MSSRAPTGCGFEAMLITIQVSGEIARALRHGGPVTPALREPLRIAEEFGVAFTPLHPDTKDPVLGLYFTLEVTDPAKAEQILSRLRGSPGIDAAYVKPLDAMP